MSQDWSVRHFVDREGVYSTKYLARRLVLNRARELFACELLFRDGLQNSCDGLDLELASTSLPDTSFLIGFEKITGGHLMFINCPRDLLLWDYISLFPPSSVVVEIPEDIRSDGEVIDAGLRLKAAGYVIALDEFVDSPACAAPFAFRFTAEGFMFFPLFKK